LLGDHRFRTAFDRRIGRREIERAEHAGQTLAIDEAINCAATARGVGNIRRATATAVLQPARHRQERVAHRLERQSLPVHAPEQAVFWVGLLGCVVERGG
jgi:hypothetical protein